MSLHSGFIRGSNDKSKAEIENTIISKADHCYIVSRMSFTGFSRSRRCIDSHFMKKES